MSTECPTSPVYRTTPAQKLKAQEAARKYRHGTPKLRDLLREKCRIRMHEARQACFEQKRGIKLKELKVDEILRQELAELEHDIDLQQEIYKELLDEVNAWFVEQLEQEENFLINIENDDALLCPVCQKAALECVREHDFACACRASFSFAGTLDALRQSLKAKVDEHEQNCMQALCFFVEPQTCDANVLNAFCATCDYFSSL